MDGPRHYAGGGNPTRIAIRGLDEEGDPCGRARELEVSPNSATVNIHLLRPGGKLSDGALVVIFWRPDVGWHLQVHGPGGAESPALEVTVPDIGQPYVSREGPGIREPAPIGVASTAHLTWSPPNPASHVEALSGRLAVGHIWKQGLSGPAPPQWHWRLRVEGPQHLTPIYGRAADLDGAKSQLEASWHRWIELADLHEA